MIPKKPGHNGCPISHFMNDDQPWDGISGGVGHSHPRPPSDQHQRRVGGGSSTALADDGRSLLTHPSRLMRSARNSMYSASSMPALTNGGISSRSVSDLSSTLYNQQMYNLTSDSFGDLYTYRYNAGQSVGIHSGASREGMYYCLFAFDGCAMLSTLDTWKAHVNAHMSDIRPPESCTCTICDEKFESGIPEVTWSRFLDHILYHKYPRAVKPDPAFLEFCQDKGIISDYTSQRFDPNFTTNPASPEPYQYRERERERERTRTPRRFAPIESHDVAQVEYPSSWGEAMPVMQQAIERDIEVNRGNSRAHRGRRV